MVCIGAYAHRNWLHPQRTESAIHQVFHISNNPNCRSSGNVCALQKSKRIRHLPIRRKHTGSIERAYGQRMRRRIRRTDDYQPGLSRLDRSHP